jgi:hypothetical protein
MLARAWIRRFMAKEAKSIDRNVKLTQGGAVFLWAATLSQTIYYSL